MTETVRYAELHAHTAFSFLDGASMPEELVAEALRLELHALAITDHDGLAGAARFAEAAAEARIPTVFGAELSIGLAASQRGQPDPRSEHLLLLARGPEGYRRLASAITAANLQAESSKGLPKHDLDELSERSEGHWVVLTGCRKGAVRQALMSAGEGKAPRSAQTRAAAAALDALVTRFGAEQVAVELTDLGAPLDALHNQLLANLAQERGLRTVATGNVHYASPDQARLAAAVAAVRSGRSVTDLAPWWPATGTAHLRSAAEMAVRFERYPGAVAESVAIANETSFALQRLRPELPDQDVPAGHTPDSWLRQLTWRGITDRSIKLDEEAASRIEHELAIIAKKKFAGYFLIVNDIVRFARSRGILCQGRGSAAASAVCYLLGITAIDPIRYRLPFERFISELREKEPDIDVDFESGRREEVIQYVYERYGRQRAAQVSNVIQYRARSAVRDMAKALGYSIGQQDAWSRQLERRGLPTQQEGHDIPADVIDLAQQLVKHPRHLGIHPGGMVLTKQPVGEVVPIEPARMPGRTVLQWDKDDCAWMGLVKFDLLGLGMLSAIRHCFDLAFQHLGESWDLASIPKEEAGVYDQLCRADAIGVFQVESRAQMGLLPRLQPREFYHLVVQIALVRPGPIQGGAVHPYVRRRSGLEAPTALHPDLEPVLKRTLGVPVFQEQLMQIAMTVGGCDAQEADQLRRAMGSKRGMERIEKLKQKLYASFGQHGIYGEGADRIYRAIQSFADFGFAESHALSFALLVYASAWLRLHYPAIFLAALLRSQPMGFYSPQTLVADARRHGVSVLRPCIQRSGVGAGLERLPQAAGSAQASGPVPATGSADCLATDQPPVPGKFDPDAAFDPERHRRDGELVLRQGLEAIRGIGTRLATRIVAEREAGGTFTDLIDLSHRVGLDAAQLEALAAAGCFEIFGMTPRDAMWAAGRAAKDRPGMLAGTVAFVQPPLFTGFTPQEELQADYWATGLSPDNHPISLLRNRLREQEILAAGDLAAIESGRRVRVAGVVTHRQRPATARGVTFINIEDETGMTNVICGVGFWQRHRRVLRDSPALILRGMLERSPQGVVNILADGVEPLELGTRVSSRDFR